MRRPWVQLGDRTMNPDDFAAAGGRVEPNAVYRQAATNWRAFYVALIDEGFEPDQAIAIAIATFT